MTYHGYHIVVEVPSFSQYELTDDGSLGSFMQHLDDDVLGDPWFVVQDGERCYVESLGSLLEAKQFIDWLTTDHGRSSFRFEPLKAST